MDWLKRLFGGTSPGTEALAASSPGDPAPSAPPVAKKRARQGKKKRPQTLRPIDIAKRFARLVPGATVEDFGEAQRDDRLLARVTFVHQGVTSRLVILSDPDEYSAVWLETRSIGKFGHFDVCRTAVGASFEVEEPRFFLTPTCFISGERLRNESARVLMLSDAARERLLALSARVDTVALYEEVMHAFLGDLFALWEILDNKAQGAAYLLELCAELAFLSEQLPAVAEEVADLAEARTCRFCGGSFVFAPSKPSCTGCGAPAESAVAMPPRRYIEIPDNPILKIDEDEREDHQELMDTLREGARVLSELVQSARVREEPERGRVFVEYELDGRAFRVKLMEEYAGVRVAAAGAKGDFFLRWSNVHVEGAKEGSAWRESERRVFFSKHCSVSSDHTTKEAARIASLPAAARALLVERCERDEALAQLEEEFLASSVEVRTPEQGARDVLKCSRELALIADALPRDFDPDDTRRYRLQFCGHCRWEYFLDQNEPCCVHCGAPAVALPQSMGSA